MVRKTGLKGTVLKDLLYIYLYILLLKEFLPFGMISYPYKFQGHSGPAIISFRSRYPSLPIPLSLLGWVYSFEEELWDTLIPGVPPSSHMRGSIHSFSRAPKSFFQCTLSDRLCLSRWSSCSQRLSQDLAGCFGSYGEERTVGTISEPREEDCRDHYGPNHILLWEGYGQRALLG